MLLGFVVVLLATALVSRRPLSGAAWLLLRSVVPAWRFFEDVEATTELYIRVAPEEADDFGPWQAALTAPPHRWTRLIFNPAGNLALAEQSLVEALSSELDGCAFERVTELVAYRLVQELVKQRLRERGAEGGGRYQFRLDVDGAEAFVSEGHAL